jgi:5,10-methylenetetrahydromethanopterin reductase
MLRTGALFINEFDPDRWRALAQTAEALSFDYLWQADERFFREVYSGLTFAAVHTRRIALGPCVTDPYSRHPALTAMAVATLDEFSGGRAVLVLGAGKSGFGELGIARHKPAVAIREAITLIRRLWRGETTSLDGEVIRFRDGHLNFSARPDIRIFVASEGPVTLRTAGELADGVIIGSAASEATLGPALQQVRHGLARAGRDPAQLEIGVRLDACLAGDAAAARRALKPIMLRMLLRYRPDYEPFISAGLTLPEHLRAWLAGFEYRGFSRDREKVEAAAEMVPDEFITPFCLAGSPAEARAQLEQIQGLGISHVTIHPVAAPGGTLEDVLRIFAHQAQPARPIARPIHPEHKGAR